MMSDINKDIEKNVINKLEGIRVCGDKAELWNFEAGTILSLIKKQDKELEIWKKIAGILASEYVKHVLCNNTVGGMKIREVEDILDWAKKEINKKEE